MHPRFHQPGRFFPIIKSYKFELISDITLEQPKLPPIIGQQENFQGQVTAVFWMSTYIRGAQSHE